MGERGHPSEGPVRTCIGCRRRAAPADLVRVVAREGGIVVAGRSLPGRGAWLCKDSPGCVEVARRRKAFNRALRVEVRGEAIDQLQTELADRARMV
ncbi:MAG: YlxR family protein [Actinomycetota bacterium]|nr:YlxR family protein [Actinomycetota bacterium]